MIYEDNEGKLLQSDEFNKLDLQEIKDRDIHIYYDTYV
jgi:hypothetical protein